MANPADQRFIGLDIGTSSAKGVAVDAGGAVIARASADYPLLTPKPGWRVTCLRARRRGWNGKPPRS